VLLNTGCRGGLEELLQGEVAVEDGKNKGEHHLLNFDSGDARGQRNELEGRTYQVHMALAVELDPINIAPICVLGGSDVGDEPVPREEPAMTKEVVDVEYRGVQGKTLHCGQVARGSSLNPLPSGGSSGRRRMLVEDIDDEGEHAAPNLDSGDEGIRTVDQRGAASRHDLHPIDKTIAAALSRGDIRDKPVSQKEPVRMKEIDEIEHRGVGGE
jgi:hypothetical protein